MAILMGQLRQYALLSLGGLGLFPPLALATKPDITIDKFTNGAEAGVVPQIAPGNVVTWTYEVTNTSAVALNNVTVTDDQPGVKVCCPQSTLEPGKSMTCTASGRAVDLSTDTIFHKVLGLCGGIPNTPLYRNKGTVTGHTEAGQVVEDAAFSYYCNPQQPAIQIVKRTNGVGAGAVPQIAPGNGVTWTYEVSNTGNVALNNLTVTDDQPGVRVSCPQSILEPGEAMTCTASGRAVDLSTDTTFTKVLGLCGEIPNTPLYQNEGTVTGHTEAGQVVEDAAFSYYCNPQQPAIQVVKRTNGVGAGAVPQIAPGNGVTWTYEVSNTGNVTLNDLTVTDDQPGVRVSCPQTILNPGKSMTCVATGRAVDLSTDTIFHKVPGLCGGIPNTPLYQNKGTVTGHTEAGQVVEDAAFSYYCNPQQPAIQVVKRTNGVQAADPNAGDVPQIAPGNGVTWTYEVGNTGNVTLNDLTVTDDQPGVRVSCPRTMLEPGEAMTCTAGGTAVDLWTDTTFTKVPGLCGGIPNTPIYENRGTATGQPGSGPPVTSADLSHYCNPQQPAIRVVKRTNGVQAADPNAGDVPQIAPGKGVTWTYEVSNTGNVTLNDLTVTDDQPDVRVSCPRTMLNPSEVMTCTASGRAVDLLTDTIFHKVPGLCNGFPQTPLYENRGTAKGQTVTGQLLQAIDLSHYCNPQSCPPPIQIPETGTCTPENGALNGSLEKIARDAFGNLYVTGYAYDCGTYNIHLLKYDRDGNLIWHQQFDSGGQDFAYGLAVGPDHAVYVAGYGLFGNTYRGLLLKYNPDGVLQWQRQFTSGGLADTFYGVAADGTALYAVGESFNGVNFDGLFVKYDLNGNLIWRGVRATGRDDTAYAVALINCAQEQRDGLVVPVSCQPVVGGGDGTDVRNGWLIAIESSTGVIQRNAVVAPTTPVAALVAAGDGTLYAGGTNANRDWEVMRLDSGFNKLWSVPFNGNGDGLLRDLTLDAHGVLFGVGRTFSGTNQDVLVLAYDSVGTLLSQFQPDSGGDESGHGIAFNVDQRLFVAGLQRDTWLLSRTPSGQCLE